MDPLLCGSLSECICRWRQWGYADLRRLRYAKRKQIWFSSFYAYSPSQPQFHEIPFHQLIMIAIIIIITISAAPGRLPCVARKRASSGQPSGRELGAVPVPRGRSPSTSCLAGALLAERCPMGAFVRRRGRGARRLPGCGRATPGQSMTSPAAATHRPPPPYITISPRLGETEPNRLLVVSPLFMDKKKAWEKSRDPRPSLRTAEYCLHGNEGNKTANARSSLPRQAGTHKSGVCNRKDGAKAAQCAEEITSSNPSAEPAAAPGKTERFPLSCFSWQWPYNCFGGSVSVW